MKLVTCTRCNSQFDVSKMAAGSSFACAKCKSVLQVPGGGASSGPAKLPKAMADRARTAGPDKARAGGTRAQAAAPPPAPPPGRSSRPRRQRTETSGGGGGGGKTGLFIGIGAGVLLIGGGAFVLLGRGGDEPGGGGGTDTASTDSGGDGSSGGPSGLSSSDGTPASAGGTSGGGSGTPAAVMDEFDTFRAMPPTDQRDDITKRVMGAQTSLEKLKELADWLGNEKLAGLKEAKAGRERVANLALEKDPELEWPHALRGEKNGLALLRTCKDDEAGQCLSFPDDDTEMLLEKIDLLDDGTGWVADKDYAELEELCVRIRERAKQLESDPMLVRAEEIRKWTQQHNLLKTKPLEWVFAKPYVIFQEVPAVEGAAEMDEYNLRRKQMDKLRTGRRLLSRDAAIFQELERHFRELFAERFKLPELEDKSRLLKALVLYDRDTFNEFYKEQNGSYPAGFLRAYYSPLFKHIIHYVGGGSVRSQDEIRCADGHVQKQSDQVTFHEGTHQLVHEYGAIFNGAPLVDDPTLSYRHRTMWFSEGIAEFMGAVEVPAEVAYDLKDVNWRHNRLLLGRVNEGRHMRRAQAPTWSIADMLVPTENKEMYDKAAELFPNNPTGMISFFYVRGWALVHFLWYYDGGKYRDHLFTYMEAEFKGTSSPETLSKAFGRSDPKDWGEIEKEFDWYWNEILGRPIGRKTVNGVDRGWHEPETGAPEGAYDPDDEGGDDYDD